MLMAAHQLVKCECESVNVSKVRPIFGAGLLVRKKRCRKVTSQKGDPYYLIGRRPSPGRGTPLVGGDQRSISCEKGRYLQSNKKFRGWSGCLCNIRRSREEIHLVFMFLTCSSGEYFSTIDSEAQRKLPKVLRLTTRARAI